MVDKEKQNELERKLIIKNAIRKISNRNFSKEKRVVFIKDKSGELYLGLRPEIYGEFNFISYDKFVANMKNSPAEKSKYSKIEKIKTYLKSKF